MGILHQGFDAYAENLDPTAQREWEKVAGRFEELLFNQPLDQIAELIAAALRVRVATLPAFARDEARSGLDVAMRLGLFGRNLPNRRRDNLASRIYPLHGTTVPAVVRAFSRFGQNERSLFSFLLSDEPFSLQSFSHRAIERGGTYRMPDFYDYMRVNFGYRLSMQSYRSHWTQIRTKLTHCFAFTQFPLTASKSCSQPAVHRPLRSQRAPTLNLCSFCYVASVPVCVRSSP
jgi:hypothetical protein